MSCPVCGQVVVGFEAYFEAVFGLITGYCVDHFVGTTHATMGLQSEGCYYLHL